MTSQGCRGGLGQIDGVLGDHEGLGKVLCHRTKAFGLLRTPKEPSGLGGNGSGVHIKDADDLILFQHAGLG